MITVVGAGLVGSLLSIFLSKRGYRVRLLERRPDMRAEVVGGGRSINLAVSVRGIHALAQAGLDQEILKVAVRMPGRLIHSVKGEVTFQRYGKDDSECIYSISRAGLNKALMTHAERAGVAIEFSRKVSEFTPLLNDSSCVFGTDGSASLIRQEMERRGLCRSVESALDYGYKELEIPPGPQGTFLMRNGGLHIWPRGRYMLIALPNFDGSFTCTLFLPLEGKSPSFSTMTNAGEVTSFFEEQFPDVINLIPSLANQFFEHPTGHMVTVKCAGWNDGGKVLLLGDAAHAIVPFFGQGMNAGFEDITLLDDSLAKGGDWETMFTEFSKVRRIDTDAIADMAVENFTEMRDKVGDPKFLLEKDVEKILQREFPDEYVSRYQLVSFSRVPYRKALEVGVAQARILSRICENLRKPEEVDLAFAHALIRSELSPLFRVTA